MQDYKIRIPNADISRQVQEKAFELGYVWASDIPTGFKVVRYDDIDHHCKIIELDSSINRMFCPITSENPEISYQDFLRLGEIDVNNCKIKLIGGNRNINLISKLTSLGIVGYGKNNPPVIRVCFWPNYPYDLSQAPDYILIRDGKTIMSKNEQYFNSLPEREVTIEQIMQLQPTINNTTTEQIMSGEVTLKCITAPQKAKNITVDRDYTGILIDSDDSQVDTLREATHFRCVNNNGIEAKYKLSLFAPPEPPPPAKITQQELIDELTVNSNDVTVGYNGNTVEVLDIGRDILSMSEVNCSCGIKSCNGLNELIDIISEYDFNHIDAIVSDFNVRSFSHSLFKLIVEAKIQQYTTAMILFSTVEDEEIVCELMDSICEKHGGVSTDFMNNPNSGNQIKAWLIPKN